MKMLYGCIGGENMRVYLLYYEDRLKGIYSTPKAWQKAMLRYQKNNKDAKGHMILRIAKIDPERPNL